MKKCQECNFYMREVKIDGMSYNKNCKIYQMSTWSSHIMALENIKYMSQINTPLIVLNHSDEDKKYEFRDIVEEELRKRNNSAKVVCASIENNIFLAETFINELETRRKFKVKGCNCLVLLCGENNILKNLQSNCNNVVVRIGNKSLVQRFKQVLNSSDIILNIIHQPQYGNQNKLHKRREFFSQNNRTYLSTNNCKKLSSSVKSTQYVYRNGIKIDCPEPIIDDNGRYMYRVFSL